MKILRKLLIVALMVVFPMVAMLTGCFSANNVYYKTEDIISSATGYMWKLSNSDFSETTFGDISPASFSNGKMPYERWATLDLSFSDNWGDATFAFLIFTVETQTEGELHIVVSVNEIIEYETTIYAVEGGKETLLLGDFQDGEPWKLRISNTPPVKEDEEGNEEEEEEEEEDYTGYEILWRINDLQVIGVPNEE